MCTVANWPMRVLDFVAINLWALLIKCPWQKPLQRASLQKECMAKNCIYSTQIVLSIFCFTYQNLSLNWISRSRHNSSSAGGKDLFKEVALSRQDDSEYENPITGVRYRTPSRTRGYCTIGSIKMIWKTLHGNQYQSSLYYTRTQISHKINQPFYNGSLNRCVFMGPRPSFIHKWLTIN